MGSMLVGGNVKKKKKSTFSVLSDEGKRFVLCLIPFRRIRVPTVLKKRQKNEKFFKSKVRLLRFWFGRVMQTCYSQLLGLPTGF